MSTASSASAASAPPPTAQTTVPAGGNGVAAAGVDAIPVPLMLAAETLNWCDRPLTSPVTVTDVAGPDPSG